MNEWRPMFSAPKDGTKIIVIHTDFSGVAMLYWGEAASTGEEGWVTSEHEFTGPDESWAGWIPAPASTPDYGQK